jgi:hypothetical protein
LPQIAKAKYDNLGARRMVRVRAGYCLEFEPGIERSLNEEVSEDERTRVSPLVKDGNGCGIGCENEKLRTDRQVYLKLDSCWILVGYKLDSS